MRLKYSTAVEDMLAFRRYHHAHSPAIRRELWLVIIAGVAIGWTAIASGVVDIGLTGGPVPYAVGLAGGAILAVLLGPRLLRRMQDRTMRRMLAEGANAGLLGPREMELDGDCLVVRTQAGESRTRLTAVERVASDGGRTYVYVSALSAHVIPHAAVTDGDPAAFVAALERRLVTAAPGTSPDV